VHQFKIASEAFKKQERMEFNPDLNDSTTNQNLDLNDAKQVAARRDTSKTSC
jgi:hypothetical protein